MTSKSNNAAGGTSGVTVTPANSGGASGTSWDSVTSTGSITFDNTHLWDSRLAYKFSTIASAQSILTWSTSFSDDEVFGTFYAYFSSYATASTSTAAVRIRGGSLVQSARLSWNASGQIRISDTTTSNSVTMTTASPVNAYFRIDYHVKVSTGVSDVWLYKNNPDAPIGSFDDHISTSGALYGINPVDEFGFGCVANNANVGPYWFSNISVSNIAVPGPPQLWEPGMPQQRRSRPIYVQPRKWQMPPVRDQLVIPETVRPKPRIPQKAARGRIASPPPQIVVIPPTYPLNNPRKVVRLLGRVRGRSVAPVPAQIVLPPTYPIVDTRKVYRVIGRIKGRSATPVPPQTSVYPVNSRRILRPISKLRGHSVTPVPPQIFQWPPYPAREVNRLRQVMGRTRGKTATSPPPQALPGEVHHSPRRLLLPRRGRTTTPVPLQAVVVSSYTRRIRNIFGRKQGRTSTPIPPQVVLPPPYPVADTRRMRPMGMWRRGRSSAPAIGQPVIAPPPYVPKPSHRIRQLVTAFRRRLGMSVEPNQVPTPPSVNFTLLVDVPTAKWNFTTRGTQGEAYGAPIGFLEPQSKWLVQAKPTAAPIAMDNPIGKWAVGLGGIVLAMSSVSLEYVRVPVTASAEGQFVNPTGDVVQMAFIVGSGTPGSGDWKNAIWDSISQPTSTYVAQCLVGPGGTVTLATGVYSVWVKVIDNPEIVVRSTGTLTII